jgi:hypothetical protein
MYITNISIKRIPESNMELRWQGLFTYKRGSCVQFTSSPLRISIPIQALLSFTTTLFLTVSTFLQPKHLSTMAKARNTTASRKHVEDESSSSTEVVYETEWSATPPKGINTGLPFFEDTRANIKNIAAHPESFRWVREFGDRDILCWEEADGSCRKAIQLITTGKIRTADLEAPNKFNTYTVDLQLDERNRDAFEQLWQPGKFGNKAGLSVPINDLGIARFTAKLDAINKDAAIEKKINLILTENDPFPGLHDGSVMHPRSTELVPRPVADFIAGATVAVEATVATYDFTSSDGSRRFGYSLSLREVYWLVESGEDDVQDQPSTPSG